MHIAEKLLNPRTKDLVNHPGVLQNIVLRNNVSVAHKAGVVYDRKLAENVQVIFYVAVHRCLLGHVLLA